MKLYSHPRSGTNWTLALLEQAFYGTQTHAVRVTGHYTARWKVQTTGIHLWGNHCHFNATMPGPRLYLYRDGRDVALPLWRTKGFQPAEWHGLSFAEFLRTPLDWWETPGQPARGPRVTIAEHWRLHLDSWYNAPDTLFIRSILTGAAHVKPDGWLVADDYNFPKVQAAVEKLRARGWAVEVVSGIKIHPLRNVPVQTSAAFCHKPAG